MYVVDNVRTGTEYPLSKCVLFPVVQECKAFGANLSTVALAKTPLKFQTNLSSGALFCPQQVRRFCGLARPGSRNATTSPGATGSRATDRENRGRPGVEARPGSLGPKHAADIVQALS